MPGGNAWWGGEENTYQKLIKTGSSLILVIKETNDQHNNHAGCKSLPSTCFIIKLLSVAE